MRSANRRKDVRTDAVETKEPGEKRHDALIISLDAGDLPCCVRRVMWTFEGRSLSRKTFSNRDTPKEDVSNFYSSTNSSEHPSR
jgi:hypothetical protein